MILANDTAIPVVSMLPVVNSKQQLVALIPDFGSASIADPLPLLHYLKEVEFFEKLSSIFLLIPISDPTLLPADLDERINSLKVAFCVREASCVDLETRTKLKYFTSKGFRVFMDDFSSKSSLVWEDTKLISVDCHAGLPFFIKPWLFSLHTGQHLAKNISTPIHLQEALDAGFALFSGDYAFSPSARNKSTDNSGRTRLLKLLGLVSRDAESRELEDLFKQDTTLSFMLFKLVSSAAFSQAVRVSSFGQAINLLGRRQLQRWLQLLLYARQDEHGAALNPLMLRAAFRASMMEAICQHHGGNKDQQDCAFMIGMFSLLDKLFGSPLEEILRPLNLKEDVLDALLYKTGILGQQLRLVELADRNKTGELQASLAAAQIDGDMYYQCLTQAYIWANQVCQEI